MTTNNINTVISEMIRYYTGDVRRINHFMKVYGFAKIIGEGENLDNKTQLILELAAAVHDIGIKMSEEKYQSSSGRYQEIEGPAIAEELLEGLSFDNEIIKRVSYLVGNHHTYGKINGVDFQILVEADFLVNIYEDELKKETVEKICENHFKLKLV